MNNKRLLIVLNVESFLITHRLGIAKEALKQGWEVYCVAKNTGRTKEISDLGIKFIDLPLSRHGINPIQEIKTLWSLFRIYWKIKPEVVHHVTIKPVVYGSIAAKWLRVKKVVNAISGLGYNFTGDRKTLARRIIVPLMKYGFNRKNLTVIFQNRQDEAELKKLGIINKKNKIVTTKGSGVDLTHFIQSDFPTGKIKILFPARMSFDKGILELKAATELLKDKYKDKIQFILSGGADIDAKAGVTEEYLNDWQDGEYVKWIGYQKNMFEVYKNSHIVILPSYREGMPKSLLEACAVGRAIITTDAIGCRECVDDGVNGFKVPVKNIELLVKSIEELVNNQELIQTMGERSHKKANAEFDVRDVIVKHINIYNNSVK